MASTFITPYNIYILKPSTYSIDICLLNFDISVACIYCNILVRFDIYTVHNSSKYDNQLNQSIQLEFQISNHFLFLQVQNMENINREFGNFVHIIFCFNLRVIYGLFKKTCLSTASLSFLFISEQTLEKIKNNPL